MIFVGSGQSCRDPRGLPFLQLALAAKAEALVTDASDVRVLATIAPARAIERLSR